MGQRRKNALKRMAALAERVDEHLAKIADNPGHPATGHWFAEVKSWLSQIEEALQHVGKKTSHDWQQRLEAFHERLDAEDPLAEH